MQSKDLTIEKFSKTHQITKFDCGEKSLNDFICYEALKFHEEGLGITYLAYCDTQLVGFVTISMADLKGKEIKGKFPLIIENYPALQIGQLAINKKIQKKGIGRELVKWCMNKAVEYSKDIGCRLLVLNALSESVGFYEKCNFIELKQQKGRKQKTMYLVIPKKMLNN